jgi:hypothetical protein
MSMLQREKRKKGRRSLKRAELILHSAGWRAMRESRSREANQLGPIRFQSAKTAQSLQGSASMTFPTLTGQWEEVIFTCRPRKIFS